MAERGLTLKPVKTPWGFDLNRRIRNECYEFLTHNPNYISPISEIGFWLKNYRNSSLGLYVGYEENNKAIAYGLISADSSDGAWISGGLRKGQRGKGYGRLLFEGLCSLCLPRTIYLEVLANNTPALNLYYSLGFQEIARADRGSSLVLTMIKGAP